MNDYTDTVCILRGTHPINSGSVNFLKSFLANLSYAKLKLTIVKIEKLHFKTFKYIYSKVPRLCVDLIVKSNHGILLTKRAIPPQKGFWHLPGGTVLMHETIKEAVQRVAQEELGTKVKILKFLNFLEYTQGSGFGYSISAVFLVCPLLKIVGGKQAKEVKFFKNFPEKTLPEIKKYLKRFSRSSNN